MKRLNYQQWLTYASAELMQFSTPLLDAYILLSYVTRKTRAFFYAYPHTYLSEQELVQLSIFLKRRIAGEPIAYIVMQQEFWSLSLHVTADTLIPRPDTESLIEQVLQRYSNQPYRVVDLGTGCGAIALALAVERPAWQIIGVDISIAALKVAQYNAQQHAISHLSFIQGDWFSPFATTTKFNLIVSNPPYLANNDQHLNCIELCYEPRDALVSDQDGLAALTKIIVNSGIHLLNNGRLIVEHGWKQGEIIRQLFITSGFKSVKTVRDYGGNERVTCGEWVA